MAKNYIDEIAKKNLTVSMEKDFQNEYPFLLAQLKIPELPTRIQMTFITKNHEFAGYFIATNFDVKQEPKPQNYQFLQDAKWGADCKSIKKWYIKWMKNHFETYKEDFLAYLRRQAENEFDI